MAGITLTGTLTDVAGSVCKLTKIIFVPLTNTADTLAHIPATVTTDSTGAYSITLTYNTYNIFIQRPNRPKTQVAVDLVIDSNTTATDINQLI